MHLSSKERPWGKPFTFKRYIHPPLAENMVTMWPSSMVMFGEIKGGNESHVHFNGRGHMSALPSTGVIFTLNGNFLPWTKVKYSTRKDGFPIHAFSHLVDGINFRQECFCDAERVPISYIKVTVKNVTDSPLTFDFGAMVRSGPEFDLVGCDEPDGYRWFEQLKKQWLTMPPFIKYSNKLTNGIYTFKFSSSYRFTEKNDDDLSVNLTLNAGESKTYYFNLTRNKDKKPLSYAKAKLKCEAFWKKELAKAKFKPKQMKKSHFYNLIVQSLQMTCYPKDENYVLFRQGGIERHIYPKEAEPLFLALSEIGGYDDYLDKVLYMYFNTLQVKEGENKGQVNTYGFQWSTLTAAAVQSYAYVAKNNKEIYDKYYKDAMAGFNWMEKTRLSTKTDPTLVQGIFPPWVSCDFGGADQVWSYTDTWNIEAYETLLEVAKKYSSPDVANIENALKDYRQCVQARFDELAKESEGKDEWIVPRDARNNPEIEAKLNKQFEFLSYSMVVHQCEWLKGGFAGYETPLAKKIFKHYEKEAGVHMKRHGHYAPMSRDHKKGGSTYSPPVGQRWYTSFYEYALFKYFKRIGKTDLVEGIINGQLKYATSNEGYMVERFCDHNAYWSPWLPNASANGRIINMMMAHYGKEEL